MPWLIPFGARRSCRRVRKAKAGGWLPIAPAARPSPSPSPSPSADVFAPPPALPPPPEPAFGPVWVPVTEKTLPGGYYRVMSPYDGKSTKDALVAGLMSMGVVGREALHAERGSPERLAVLRQAERKDVSVSGHRDDPRDGADGLVVWWGVQPSAASGAAYEQLYVSAPSTPAAPAVACSDSWRDRIIEPGCSYLVSAPTGSRVIDDMVRGGEWENARVTRGNVHDGVESSAKFLDDEHTEEWRLRLTGTFRGPRTRLPPSVAVYHLSAA